MIFYSNCKHQIFIVQSNSQISHKNVKNLKANIEFKPDHLNVKKPLSQYWQGQGVKVFCIVWYLSTSTPNKGTKHLKVSFLLSPKVVTLIREMCSLLIHRIIYYYPKCKISLLGLLPKGVLVDSSPLSLRGLIIVNDFIDLWLGSASYAPVNQAINSC